ncbi:Murein DD-endopeptidase MepM [Microbacterium azadirachtae]|uniref:Murein DD-endopeptidase MepM n=1 Tax=Microbacterium azadirachtae TaxID=582680 RepID=A0A0F0LBM7_9MICO|nr:M23 family metallopeptidase [Microbacterium azadirachtae]KJL29680.1 Murein DD-endopeptidase MepM [Microbacterium azadirachtae]
MKKLALALALLIFLGPSPALLAVGLLMTPAAQAAACLPGSLTVGAIPDELTATAADGTSITLTRTQLTHAATIITVGGRTSGVGSPGVVIALMAALTESRLRMLANTGAYPESGDYPNDGNGADHDSLGLFQMRPASGWGTVAELMDPDYQARAFYGGAGGPNYPSPRGLLDIPGWQQMDPGEAAQAVEVSAYPDRYQNYRPVAETILRVLTAPPRGGGGGSATPIVPETTRTVFPLPTGTWVRTDPFGMRVHPITGEWSMHYGTDFAAADGTPIFAIADGVVTHAGFSGGYGGLIVIEHTVGGQRVASAYAHMWENGIYVSDGQTVSAGQHIGDVGSSGQSTGAHLHFEIRDGGSSGTAVDSEPWLAEHGALDLDAASTSACRPSPAGAA